MFVLQEVPPIASKKLSHGFKGDVFSDSLGHVRRNWENGAGLQLYACSTFYIGDVRSEVTWHRSQLYMFQAWPECDTDTYNIAS